MKYELVIFDMDGTLVQSEDCASQALIDVIPDLEGTASEVTAQYRGMRLAEIFSDIESRFSTPIPENGLELYRLREEFLAASMITPCHGAQDMLSGLKLRKCIASNAPLAKTKRSLDITGLSYHFPGGIYSAYEIQAWKPDPGLFLHAAKTEGVSPECCLVVEDSKVGLRAAQAAGMRAVFYSPDNSDPATQCERKLTSLMELLDMVG